MTANEKVAAAAFLDLAGDYLAGGYRRPHGNYAFTGDAPLSGGVPADMAAGLVLEEGTPEYTAPDGDAEHLQDMMPNDSETSYPDSLEAVAADVARCTRCGLCTTRTNTVPGEGVPRPLVMVVGEGPGGDEDATGRPFVGRAGQLLDRMLDSRGKIGLSRTTNCYIGNVVKCRPPGNRNPQPEEIAVCVPFLARQILILRPKIILAAGNTAAKTLLDSSEGITRLRGIFKTFTGASILSPEGFPLKTEIPLLPTFHPSALLRDESLKAPVWEDLKTLRVKLCELDSGYAEAMADRPL